MKSDKQVRINRLLKRRQTMSLNKKLLDILVCPKCKGDLKLNDLQSALLCYQCQLMYEIKDDIPIMLIDEAKPISK